MNTISILAKAPLFESAPHSLLQSLASHSEFIRLDCGEQLYAEGELPHFFYLVANGRLKVMNHGNLVGYIGRLEPAGEMGVISGEPRNSSVHALRDSFLLRIPCEDFIAEMCAHGSSLVELTQLILQRFRKHRNSITRGSGCFAIVPNSSSLPSHFLARSLARHLGGWPKVRVINSDHVNASLGAGTSQIGFSDLATHHRMVSWFDDLESRHDYLILVADNNHDTWTQRCLRQSDRVLVLAEASQPPGHISAIRELPQQHLVAPLELVLLCPQGDASPDTLAWRDSIGARAHYFVHPWTEDDIHALARQITGQGIGLVLGGGGARGFAHIGLIRALKELQIPIDVMSGTSMGAFVSALMACGYDHVEMAQIARETFVNNNFLNDYTIPRVSLIRGHRFLDRLKEIFGDQRIEDLRRSFFCMSTNLSTGSAMVHDHGPLAVWVGTSMSVPGVVPPVAYEGELLCDGGVIDNLPTGIMQRLERGRVLASSVSAHGDIRAPHAGRGKADPGALLQWHSHFRRPSFKEILMRSATLTADSIIAKEATEKADIMINMPVKEYGMFAWKSLDELIERGYQHALEQLTPQRDQLTL